MDKNYWRNRFCFILLNEIGLFPLENSFVEVQLNDKSQGIYLLIQKTDDYTDQIDSPLLLRREQKGERAAAGQGLAELFVKIRHVRQSA